MADRAAAPKYQPLGGDTGLHVRFSPGFGLNVYLSHRSEDAYGKLYPYNEFGMSIQGWERLCELVDEWRARCAA